MNQSRDGVEERLRHFLHRHGGRIEHILDRIAPEESIDPNQMLSIELLELIRTVAKIDGGITRPDALLAVKVLDCLWAGLVPEELRRRGKDFELQYFVSRLPQMPRDEFFCTLKCMRQFDIEYGSHDAEQYAELMRTFIFREVGGIHTSQPSKHVIAELVAEIDQIMATGRKADTSASCEECKRCYALLGLNPEATHEEVRKKRRAFAEVLHPDQLGGKTENARRAAEEQLKRVNEACDHILRCRADHNSPASPVCEDVAVETESPAGYQAEPTTASSKAGPPKQGRWNSGEGSSGGLWGYTKISLRTIWRSTKVVLVLALALLLSAIIFMGLVVYLKDYWDGESRRSRGEADGGLGAETLFAFLNGIMWLPRHIWYGLMMILSGLTIAVFVAGRWFTDVATENLTATVLFASLCGFLLLAWAFLKERRAEFDPSLEIGKPTTVSWVMGIVVLGALASAFIWWSPSVSPADWIAHYSTSSGSKATAHSPFDAELNSNQSSAFVQSAARQPFQHTEFLPTQNLWDLRRPEAVHRPEPVGDFEVSEAMEFLFGNYDPEGRSSKWSDNKNHVPDSRFDVGTASLYFDSAYTEGGLSKHVLLTATLPEGDYSCHVCSPITSIFIFANRDGKWKPESVTHLPDVGSWGKAPIATLTEVGPNQHGLIFSISDSAQGTTMEEDILLIQNSSGALATLTIVTLENNLAAVEPACEQLSTRCFSEKGNYQLEEESNPQFYDVVITRTGTRWDDGVTPANGTVHCRFKNGTYILDESTLDMTVIASHSDSGIAPDHAIRFMLESWAAALRRNEVSSVAKYYAPSVERYFLQHSVSRDYIQNYLQSKYDSGLRLTSFRIGNVVIDMKSPDEAVVSLTKQWEDSQHPGEVRSAHSVLHLQRIEGWKITSERDMLAD